MRLDFKNEPASRRFTPVRRAERPTTRPLLSLDWHFDRKIERELGERVLGTPVVDEGPTHLLPQMAVLELVVDQYVAFLRMVALVARHGGDDPGAGKVSGGPA